MFLSISPRTLRAWRSAGFGPAWVRQGRFVRYDPAEVRRWLAEDCSWHSGHLHVLVAHSDGRRRWVKAGERSVP